MATPERKEPKAKDQELMKTLRLVVQRAGGAKRVAGQLWPDIRSPQTAHSKLLACLDPRGRAHFTPEDLIALFRLGRSMADHSAMELFASFCGYSKPHPITSADEAAELQRRFLQAFEEYRPAVERLEALKRKEG